MNDRKGGQVIAQPRRDGDLAASLPLRYNLCRGARDLQGVQGRKQSRSKCAQSPLVAVALLVSQHGNSL